MTIEELGRLKYQTRKTQEQNNISIGGLKYQIQKTQENQTQNPENI